MHPLDRGDRRRKPFPALLTVHSVPDEGLIQGIFPREARFPVRGVVLLMEPEAPLRWSLGNALVNAGYSVAEAATLAQAVALLEKVSFDVLLLDQAAPGGAGWELPPRFIEAAALTTPLILLPARQPSSFLEQHPAPQGTVLPQPPWLEDLLRAVERVSPMSGSTGRAILPPEAAAREG